MSYQACAKHSLKMYSCYWPVYVFCIFLGTSHSAVGAHWRSLRELGDSFHSCSVAFTSVFGQSRLHNTQSAGQCCLRHGGQSQKQVWLVTIVQSFQFLQQRSWLFHSAIVRPVRQTRLSAAVWFDGWPECSGYPRPSIFGLFTLPRPRQQLSLGRFQWNWPSFLGLHGFSLHHLHVMVDITTYHKRHHEATLVKPQNEDASREFEKVEKKATKAVICLQEVS